MAKKMKQMLSVLVAAVMVVFLIPIGAFAANPHENQVHIIVENNTYPVSAGAVWDGTLVDTWVTIDTLNPTALKALETAVGGSSYLHVTNSGWGDYIAGIGNGSGMVSEYDGGSMAGWMFSVNGAYASVGISSYTSLKSGDEFTFSYSLDYGADLGQQWDITKNKLRALNVSSGVLSPSFSSDVTAYTLTIPAGITGVIVTPELENPACTMEITSGTQNYNRNTEIPVVDGTEIQITNEISVWNSATGTSDVSQSVYTIQVKEASNVSVDTMLQDVTTVYQGMADVYKYGNEWIILSLARADKLSAEGKEAYYQDLVNTVEGLQSNKLDSYATTNERVVLTLSAIGKNPADVAGYNLLEPLADMSYITAQGQNAAIYALLAFDSKQYTIPAAPAGATQTTREGLIQYLLDQELASGGWDWSATSADPDLTAMAIQALAPYYAGNAEVKTAVDRGLTVLSGMQNPDGSYASWGTTNSNSTAQVVLALTSMGINPDTDSRFLKNGYSALRSLGDYYIPGSGFGYTVSDTTANSYATVQVYEALVASKRFTNQNLAFFNMKDVEQEEPTTEEVTTTTESVTTTAAVTTATTAEAKTGAVPKTGDTAPIAILAGLALLTAMGSITAMRRKK